MQQREGLSSGVVVFRDVQEAEGHSTAEQETADHTQWGKEGKLMTIDPARRRDGEAQRSFKEANVSSLKINYLRLF